MAGAVGDDGMGDIALAGLHGAGVNTDAVAAIHGPTGTASINVNGDGENTIVVFPGANAGASHTQLPSRASKPMTCFYSDGNTRPRNGADDKPRQ